MCIGVSLSRHCAITDRLSSDLLTTCGERPEQLEAKSLRAFILHRAHSHGKGKAKNVVTATRMFVRFLIASGRCMPGLDDAIPTIAMWRLATLPPVSPCRTSSGSSPHVTRRFL